MIWLISCPHCGTKAKLNAREFFFAEKDTYQDTQGETLVFEEDVSHPVCEVVCQGCGEDHEVGLELRCRFVDKDACLSQYKGYRGGFKVLDGGKR